jgi:predicted ATPase
MDRVFFEGIRCFATRQEVPLAPLTVLVGENSSGKSTVLALIRLAFDLVIEENYPDFNEEPFLLGAFDQIASHLEKEKEGRRSTFTIGWRMDGMAIEGQFVAHKGQPILARRRCEIPPYSLEALFSEDGSFHEQILLTASPGGSEPEDELEAALDLQEDLREGLYGLARPYAFAPIRTRPQRTYDPIKRLASPEGDHIPLLLANSIGWQELVTALESFGKQSGLFTKVDVRRLGASESDPFQIQVHIAGRAINLIDVGYGISQILPIIVDCIRGEEGSTYLLQQPEVHLHPRAQAELGSFLGVLAKQQDKRFVIETHSDYLVDRIRMDIRDKKGITPEDVALLYFERKNGEATIHRLELDDQGNILNTPPGYRRFFLEEERRFLGG